MKTIDRKLRVGVAGVGFVGITHVQAYQQLANVELIAIADPDDQRGNGVANQAGCTRYRTYDEMLAQADLDVINVCLPPVLHLTAAEAAAQAGVHILMEKPLARTLAEAERMVERCRAAGVYLMTGFTHHFYPEMLAAKAALRRGVIGQPLTVLDTMSLTHAINPPWYRDREIAGGGVLMCNAVHSFDRISWLLDRPIQAVAALIESSAPGVGEDYGSVLAQLAGGVQATCFQHWGPYPTCLCELQIYGTEGMMHIRSWDSLEIFTTRQHTTEHFYYRDQSMEDRVRVGMVAELTALVEAIRAGVQPQPAGEAGRAALAVTLAVYEAAARRVWVTVE